MKKEPKKDQKEETETHAAERNTPQREEERSEKGDAANNNGTAPNEIDGSQEGGEDAKKNDKVSNVVTGHSDENPCGLTSKC